MKANTDHFKQFLVYCSARGLVYGFHSSQPRMQVSFQGNYVSFEIPLTVEGFDELTSKVFPEKLGVSPCRFVPETVLDQYMTYAKCQSLRGASALRSQSPSLLRKGGEKGVEGEKGGETPTE